VRANKHSISPAEGRCVLYTLALSFAQKFVVLIKRICAVKIIFHNKYVFLIELHYTKLLFFSPLLTGLSRSFRDVQIINILKGLRSFLMKYQLYNIGSKIIGFTFSN